MANLMSRNAREGEIELGLRIALLGDQPVPLRRLGVVLRDALAICVHLGEVELGSTLACRSDRVAGDTPPGSVPVVCLDWSGRGVGGDLPGAPAASAA